MIERRVIATTVALRGDGERPLIAGIAAVFYDGTDRTEFELWPGVRERIMPTAFDRALSERQDVRGLFNHDPNFVLGRTSSGTMNLSSDATGLRYEISPGDTSIAGDVREHIRRGDVQGSSFAFRVPDKGARWVEDGDLEVRELHEVDLVDVGPVTFPAYEATTVAARDYSGVREEWRQFLSKRRRRAKRAVAIDLALIDLTG